MVNDHILDEDKPVQNVETMNFDCFASCKANLSSSASSISKKSDSSINSFDVIGSENSNNSSERNFDGHREKLTKSSHNVKGAHEEDSMDWINGGELQDDGNSNSSKTDMNSSRVDAKKDEDEMSVSENEDHLPSDRVHRYTCPVCNYVVDKTSEFTAHLRKHNTSAPTDKFFNCTVCGKTLCSISSLDRHMLVHSGERPFQCTVCGMSFTTNGNMHRHMRTHGVSRAAKRCRRSAKITKKPKSENRHSNSTNLGSSYSAFAENKVDNASSKITDDKLKCNECDKSFVSVYGLQAHIETHSFAAFNCDICKLSFETVESFNEHKFVAHSKEKLGGNSVNQEAFDELQECNGFMELGKVCDFTVPKFPLIAQAWCEENPVQSCSRFHNFSCRKCKKSFPCKAALALHKKQHDTHMATYCDTCGAHFMTREKLNVHKETHILVKPETTDDQSDFLATLNLRRSSAMNDIGNKNYGTTVDVAKDADSPTEGKIKLPFMDYDKPGEVIRTFLSPVATDWPGSDLADIKDILEMTARVQSVEQLDKQQDPIVSSSTVSPGCDTKDENGNHLPEETLDSSNMDSRSGMLLCIHCNAPFSNLRSLKSHTRTHYGLSPYQCKICNYTTIDKSTLMRHLRSHNGERPYLCMLCSYAFTTKANCERHIRNKHGRTERIEILPCIKHSPSTLPASSNIDALHSPDTICCYCKKDFKFLRALQKHLRTHHSRHRNVFKPFQCKVCCFGFSTRNNCIRHVLNTHPDIDKTLVKSCVVLQTANIETVAPIAAPIDGDPAADGKSNSSLEHMESNIDGNDDSNDSCLVIDDTPMSHSATDQLAKPQDCNNFANSVSLETDKSPASMQADSPIDFSMSPIDLSMKKKPKGPDGDRCLANKNKVLHLPPPPQNSPSLEMMQDPLWVANNFPGFPVKQEPANAMEDADVTNTPLILEKCYNNALQKWICPHCADMFNSPAKLKIHSMTHKAPKKLQCYFCPNTFGSKTSLDAHLQSYHHVKKNVLDEVKFDEVFNSTFPLVKTVPQKTSIFPSLPPPNLHPPFLGLGLMPNNFAMDLEKIRNAVHSPAYTDMLKIQVDEDLYRTNYPQDRTPDYVGELNGKELRKGDHEIPSVSGTSPENLQANQDLDLTDVSKMIEATDKAKFQEFLKTQDELYSHSSSDNTTSSMTSPDTTKPSPPGIDSEKKKGRSSYSLTPHKYSCPHCERRFPWESSLQRHILTHTGQKPFKCPKCPVSFSTKSNRVRHLARKHGTISQIISPPRCKSSPFNCTICANGYSSMGNLRRHIILKHPEHNPNSLIKQSIYAVSPSDQSIDSSLSALNAEYMGNGITSSLNHFANTRTASDGDDAGDVGSNSGAEQDEDSDAAYYCRHCDDVFSSMASLMTHTEMHKASTGSDGSFRCHVCLSATFSERDHCLEHIEINHPEEYSDIVYTNGEAEEDKEANNADNVEKKLLCVFCLKKFWSSQDWRRHMRTHSGERPYECDICFRKFSLKHSMMRHRKIHSDETEPWPSTKVDSKTEHRSLASALMDDSGMGSSSSDIIQNLLGLDDASVIDRMLDNADKAAEILGVAT